MLIMWVFVGLSLSNLASASLDETGKVPIGDQSITPVGSALTREVTGTKSDASRVRAPCWKECRREANQAIA